VHTRTHPTGTRLTGDDAPTDADLIAAFRRGQDAFGTLYQRHVAAATNVARLYARSPAETEDLVSTAFMRVLSAMRGGRGPDSTFRAYLLAAVRNSALKKIRHDRTIRIDPTDDLTAFAGSEPFPGTAITVLERALAVKAFAVLPERWRIVLWHLEIEDRRPVDVAPILGITPNNVSALAFRAREALREAYLLVHLTPPRHPECHDTRGDLAAWTRRRRFAKCRAADVEAHLGTCAPCRSQAARLAEINADLRPA
jgi:RNA polymerase sigma factor (sigma-70 family)